MAETALLSSAGEALRDQFKILKKEASISAAKSATPGPTRTSVVGNIMAHAKENHGLDLSEDAAINVLAFHTKFRALNNDMFGVNSLGESFATKRKGFAKFAEFADDLADSIPGGSFAKPFTFVGKLVTGKLDEVEQRKICDSYEILNPAHDPETSAKTSRAIADGITENNIEEIAACKDERVAQALAVKLYAQMLGAMAGKEKEMKKVYEDMACGKKDDDALINFVCEKTSNSGGESHAKEGHLH